MKNMDNLYDMIIVGGGPAGLSAAIYMARAKYKVLVVEKEKIGGQITITAEVVNYPGTKKISGKELTEQMRVQAEAFGAKFTIAEVKEMDLSSDFKTIHTTNGTYKALSVVLAVGANPRKLGFLGEKEFQGRGVAYCATCDGEFFTGRNVFVIGGGFAAVEEAIFLTKYAKKVTLIVREEDYTCAKTVSDQLKNHDKITTIFETEVVEVGGKTSLAYAKFRNNHTLEEWSYEESQDGGFGVFVFAGYVPNTSTLPKEIALNIQGYILTDENKKTSIDGVYAAGDVCVKQLRQVVTAVSDGAVAATSAEKWVSDLHKKYNIPEFNVIANPGLIEEQEKNEETIKEEEGFFSTEVKQQLKGVFGRFENKVRIKAFLTKSKLSKEVEGFLEELIQLTDKVTCEKVEVKEDVLLPSMELCYEDDTSSGTSFHGVPGGHEINSFVIALYNVAGPGKEVDTKIIERVQNLKKKTNIKVLVSLSCTMCPETVMASMQLAHLSDHIEAEMIDLAHFPDLKEKYQVMSVPCMVVNNESVYFGKKGLEDVVTILENTNSIAN